MPDDSIAGVGTKGSCEGFLSQAARVSTKTDVTRMVCLI